MKTKLIFPVLFLLALSISLKAQSVFGEYATREGLRLLEVGKALAAMPEAGAKPEDFVPPHWTITDRVEGDLNADGIRDFAFTMMLDEKDTKYLESLKKLSREDWWTDRVFIIVVIDSRGDKRLHVNSLNYDLYGDSDAPARNGDARDDFKLSLRKNVLDINIDYGGMMRWNATFRFRLEQPTGGDLVLIGFDYEVACVATSENCLPWKVSENYLTGTRIETDFKLKGNDVVGTDRKTAIAPVKIEFMNARLNDVNLKGYARPF
jgi:hypothetical protein